MERDNENIEDRYIKRQRIGAEKDNSKLKPFFN